MHFYDDHDDVDKVLREDYFQQWQHVRINKISKIPVLMTQHLMLISHIS